MYVANMCSHCQFDCLCVESLRRRRSTYSPAVFPARMFSDGFSLRSRTTGIAQADLFRKLRNVFFVSALTTYDSSLSRDLSICLITCAFILRSRESF